MAPSFPLVVVVHADAEERVGRLVRQRGMTEADARARIAAQADDAARRAAADVWLDNAGAPDGPRRRGGRAVGGTGCVPFEENLRLRRPAPARPAAVVDPDPRWAAARPRGSAARVAAAAGERGRGVGAHRADRRARAAGHGRDRPAARRGRRWPTPTALRDALADAGFPRVPRTPARPGGCTRSADPGRPGPAARPRGRLAGLARRAAAPGLAAGRRAPARVPRTGAAAGRPRYPERGRDAGPRRRDGVRRSGDGAGIGNAARRWKDNGQAAFPRSWTRAVAGT